MSACFCVGPKNGEPLCPCRMRNVQVRNGRYIEIIDHGPVREPFHFDALKDARKEAEAKIHKSVK